VTARSVSERYGAHAGSRATLFGKGPSVERWCDSAPAKGLDEVRVTLHEAALLVPDADYCLVLDNGPRKQLQARRWALPNGAMLLCVEWEIRPESMGLIAPLDRCLGWRDDEVVSVFPAPSAALALQILYGFGVRDVLMVGFDGYDQRVSCYGPRMARLVGPARAERRYYGGPNEKIDAVLAARPELALTWWHRENPAC